MVWLPFLARWLRDQSPSIGDSRRCGDYPPRRPAGTVGETVIKISSARIPAVTSVASGRADCVVEPSEVARIMAFLMKPS
jgi:hypothetical protein